MEKMDQEIKQKWIEALRSGKYKQGKGSMKNGDKFDVLGVLCDISGMGEWEKTLDGGQEKYLDTVYTIPIELCKKFKIKADPCFHSAHVKEVLGEKRMKKLRIKDYSYIRYSLSYLNDFGVTFEELANLIEKYL